MIAAGKTVETDHGQGGEGASIDAFTVFNAGSIGSFSPIDDHSAPIYDAKHIDISPGPPARGDASSTALQPLLAEQPGPRPATTTMETIGNDGAALALPSTNHPEWAVAIVIPFILLAIWLVVMFAISRAGWHRFAAKYRATSRSPGRRYTATNARVGGVFACYPNVVRVAFADDGLYIGTAFPFRAFHPPLLIPWSSVKSIERKDRVSGPRYRITIEDGAGDILLRLPGKIRAELNAHQAAAAYDREVRHLAGNSQTRDSALT